MTEAAWLACTDPRPMLELVRGKASDRKLRLFGVACCRRIWQLLSDARCRQAVEVAERYADAQASQEELETASDAACAVWDADMKQSSTGREKTDEPDDSFRHTASLAAYNATVPVGWWGAAPAFVAPYETAREVVPDSQVEGAAQCELIRDIFGNPFRLVFVLASWLAWNNGTIFKLAQAIYDERAFDRLPILADALEDAGCDDAEILDHCRGPGPHVHGCWVLDLLLGKE